MSFLEILYKLFIGPLELFFEIIYAVAYRLVADPAIAIIALSLAMNFLVLPLYRRADAMQEEERDRALAMKPWVDHIKKTFKSDERFMMLQTYNRQNGVKQTDVLKSSISLLLEIPFFIAAFHFLSNLQLMQGASLGPISNLGAPDALLQIGGISINVLPIFMTLINIVSAAIYLKGFPLSSKIQTYGIAAIFLILLYNSPAGLVFYWTLNNLFSLVKNIFYKLKNPDKVLTFMASIAGIAAPIAFLAAGISLSPLRTATLVIFFIVLQIPLLKLIAKGKVKTRLNIPPATKTDSHIFFLACLFLALITGLLIPLSVIQASPAEFMDTTSSRSPLLYIIESLALSIGTFVIWFGVFYWIATPKGKTVFSYLVIALAIIGVINYLFFGTNYGNLSADLQFDTEPTNSNVSILINAVVLTVVALLALLVWIKKKSIFKIAFASLSIAVIAFSLFSAVNVNKELAEVSIPSTEEPTDKHEDSLRITLSKSGKNVVVMMLDRAVPGFVPYFVEEIPELKDMLSGFTCYSNTMSFGPITNVASPALYGGSEYRPKQINERNNTPLVVKQNESLKIMPSLFQENGFGVTVFDPTYAGYTWIPDLTIYDDLPGVKAYRTMDGQFMASKYQSEEKKEAARKQMARNFFCYSLFKIAPLAIQPSIYQKAAYNSTQLASQIIYNAHKAAGINTGFLQSYAVLDNLSEITDIESAGNNFLMMSNDTTHEPALLQEPSYTPEFIVENEAYDKEHAIRTTATGEKLNFDQEESALFTDLVTHYQINMAALLRIGEWCEYLKENGVYDNTRIIIVSDHSWGLFFGDDMVFDIYSPYQQDTVHRDARVFNCLFMVKDFNSTEFTFSDEFMTNADTPVLAFKDLIINPVNPYTGNVINSDYKNEPEQYVMYSTEWRTKDNNGNTFNPGQWFSVHDDVRDVNNWTYLYEE